MSKKVDVTPTWRAAMKIAITALLNGTPEGKELAKEEILNCADVAQKYVDIFNKKSVIIENIDFKLFKEQKRAFLEIMHHVDSYEDELEGLLGILDAITDFAIDILEIPESEVALTEGK